MIFYVFAIGYAALQRLTIGFAPTDRQRSRIVALCNRARSGIEALPLWIFPVVLLGLSVVFQLLIEHARASESSSDWMRHLALPFLYKSDPEWPAAYAVIRSMLLVTVCAQSVVLAALYVATRGRPLRGRETIVVVLAAAGMMTAALLGRTLESTDVYSYVANAQLGMAASYAAPIRITDVDLQQITALTWIALPPSPYGPLWHFYNDAVAGGSTVANAVMKLRYFNAAIFVFLIGGLIVARVRSSTVCLIALNPYLYQQFIVNVHNDLVPVTALAFGAVLARRSIWFSVLGAVVAGLIKLPLCLVGIVTFITIRSRRLRLFGAATTIGAVALLSLAFGGRPYLSALLNASGRSAAASRVTTITHLIVLGFAVFAVIYALLTRRRWWPGLCSIPAFGGALYPWYLIWIAPVTLARSDAAAPLLIAVPVLAIFLSDVLREPASVRVLIYGGVAIFAVLCERIWNDDRKRLRDVGDARRKDGEVRRSQAVS